MGAARLGDGVPTAEYGSHHEMRGGRYGRALLQVTALANFRSIHWASRLNHDSTEGRVELRLIEPVRRI